MHNYALLFPGQGSQYVGMGKKMYEESEEAKRLFKISEEVLGIPLRKLCFEGEQSQLTLTYHAQPAILTVGYISFRLFMDKYQAMPLYMMGHSLGEITALTCAGVYHFEDALQIVYKRGQLMHEAVADQAGAMMSIQGLSVHLVSQIVESISNSDETVVVSNENAKNQIVISGHSVAVQKAADKLEKLGAITIPLNVSAPFHSPLMAPAEQQFRAFLDQYTLLPFQTTVVSNVDALPYKDILEVPDKLSKQLTMPVKWVDCVRYVHGCGISWAIEAAPKKVLRNLSNGDSLQVYGLDHEGDSTSIEQIMSGVVDYDATDFVRGCLALSVCTKNYNLDQEKYESGVIRQVRLLEQMQESLESNKGTANSVEMTKALDALLTILDTKLVPVEEQRHRLTKLFNTTLPFTIIRELRAYMKDQLNSTILD
ncbi:ACP S-malonyltransferase [Paenibacillus xylaniclasticus]|uniref:ACP S-malonyltransferase n=1 Tax=Paenibacillus xylaniclasticus TaxID=588083 RepID=UPI0013DF1242|nr:MULTISPECIES: ACP S-malonyltransferase [Paenibacillus]GFN30895.1 hypothetical protein PCURB6_11550 [Paenibacillus curdlanolyticus]